MKAKKTLIQRIYDALEKAGEKGLTTTRLRSIAPKFTYIITRLRKEGVNLLVVPHPTKRNIFRYSLTNA